MTKAQIETLRAALVRIASMDGRTVAAPRTDEKYAHGAEDAFAEAAGIAQRALDQLGDA